MTTAMTPGRLGGNTRGAAAQWGGRRVDSPNPWRALWAMMVGFFMILVDSTIVAVANPSIMAKLGTGYATVIWVTSAYLLAYAVPLLVAGRLGDRFGVKNLYLIGLAVFTGASLWCGLSGSIGMLITARVVQGVGAGLLTPQTLSLITRIFPPERRGVAMSVWGATAGIATLVGPLAGGVLVDGFGWEWIFFVNVPIGIAGLALAVWLVPVLPTHQHRFDPVAVGLSGAGMFLIVFALQEGQSAQWAPWIWAVLVAGIGLAVAFVYWQSINTREPLIPLKIFYSRDFTLSSLGVFVIGFATTAMVLPLMFYAQAVCGLSPTRSALLMAPMAIVSGLLAPVAGNIVDRYHPGPVIGLGFSLLAIALTWLSIEMAPGTPIWRLVLPFIVMGGGNAFIWSPLAATATRNLPAHLAGASSGVYNAARQVGAVLGSSGMAAFMTSRITAEMPRTGAGADSGSAEGTVLRLPGFLREPFSAAMSQSMLLPAFASLFGVAAALIMLGFAGLVVSRLPGRAQQGFDRDKFKSLAGATDQTRGTPEARAHGDDFFDDFFDDEDDDDDDAYVEFTLAREPLARQTAREPQPRKGFDGRNAAPRRFADDETAPLSSRVEHPRQAPARATRSDPAGASNSLFDEPGKPSNGKPINDVHNGFHVEKELDLRPKTQFAPLAADSAVAESEDQHRLSDEYDEAYGIDDGRQAEVDNGWNFAADGSHFGSSDDTGFEEVSFEDLWSGKSTRRPSSEGEPPRNRHRRSDSDDVGAHGRHSHPD